jgi:hypothetical protein
MFDAKITEAFSEYDFWSAMPLFEYFCLARILPYVTYTKEKDCVLKALSAVKTGLAIPASIPLTQESQELTVIVPALGVEMSALYSNNSPKLLAPTVSLTAEFFANFIEQW